MSLDLAEETKENALSGQGTLGIVDSDSWQLGLRSARALLASRRAQANFETSFELATSHIAYSFPDKRDWTDLQLRVWCLTI